jgi:hypothetical protein
MKSLSNQIDLATLLERLKKLRPESRRQWGKMSPNQMICHLNDDSFKGVMGEKEISPIGTIFHKTVIKWIALRSPLTWPKGVKTRPEVDQEIGGTPPVEFEKDRKELIQILDRFTRERRDFEWQPHPIFGIMSDEEWMRWGYLHVDHHLRQFGL